MRIDEAAPLPILAIVVSFYHLLILFGALLLTTWFITPQAIQACTQAHETMNQAGQANLNRGNTSAPCEHEHRDVILFVFAFGALGSTLNASRYVVFAVRHGTYDRRRVLWQILSPWHGGSLAVVAYYVVQGGLLAFANSNSRGDQYTYFLGGLSFIVGFSSELFVKRLINATEALFGERANLESAGRDDARIDDPKPPR